jgi:hypothetical protein
MTTELNRLETRLAELIAQYDRAIVKRDACRQQYQSLRDTNTAEEDTAHRRYQLWTTKAIAADYGVWQVKETIRCLKAGLITR